MALDLLARGLAASARSIAATAGDGVLPALAQFSDLPLRTIPAAAVRIVAGTGTARGDYIPDTLATAVLAVAHPLFCKADGGGRYFRLLPDDRGLIPVACGGAVGFTTAPMVATALTDERPILAAAELYRHAIGAAGVRLDARRYAVRRLALPAGTSYFDTAPYLPITVKSSSKWVSTHPEGTTIYRRKLNGQQCDLADFETTTVYGARFRGGLFFIEGTPLASGDPGPDKNSFTLDNVMLDGGLRLSMGLIFEIIDKPIWQQNDYFVGDLTFKGKSGAIGFASELVYTASATPASAALRTLTVEDTCVFGETGGSCLNPNGITTKVGRCLLYNGLIGVEGWTGDSGYFNARIRDCGASSLQGGVVSVPPLTYYEPNRPVAAHVPIGQVDVVLEKCGRFDVGSWIEGDILAIDTPVMVGGADVFNVTGAEAFNLRVRSFVDKSGLAAAVSFIGNTTGGVQIRHGRVQVDCHRTANAIANAYRHATAVSAYGSLGPGIDLQFGTLDGLTNEPLTYAAPHFNNQPLVRGIVGHRQWNPNFGNTVDIQAGAGGTLPDLPIVYLACSGTATGHYAMNLPTAGVQVGSEIIIDNFTRNNVNPGVALRIAASNFSGGAPLILGNTYNFCRVRFNGTKWDVVEAPPVVIASVVYDPPALASAASGAIQTVSVNGALPGDRVRAGFSLDLAGVAITAWVSAANTVSYYFTNLNGASGLNLGSGTVTLEVSP